MPTLPRPLEPLAARLLAHGARPVLVGGYVRDALLGIEGKDIDIEVYGLDSLDSLQRVLEPFGSVHEVGKSFGVLKMRVEGFELDFSFPRTERKIAHGHRGFDVSVDSSLPFKEAARRRDFTINAMGFDLANRILLDPYGGESDLRRRLLRCVDPKTFVEDPLRILRAVQFCARFKLACDDSLIDLCRRMIGQHALDELPKERIFEEFKKLLLKANKPSIGFELMARMDVLKHFPELDALRGTVQDPIYHPEGDVWTHTLLCLDAMASLKSDDEREGIVLMLAILCHDLGKPATTSEVDGRIRAIGHEIEGLEPTRSLLSRLSNESRLFDEILPLVEHHLKPLQFFKQGAQPSAVRRLASKVDLRKLVLVAKADFFGRTTPEAESKIFEAGEWMSRQAEALDLLGKAPKPLLQGRDLIALGLEPSPRFKRILDAAFEAQLDGEFNNAAGARAWLDEHMNSR